MIKCEIEKCMIKGHPVVVQAEFSNICKSMKDMLIEAHGKEQGVKMYKHCLELAEMSEEELATKSEEISKENPFIDELASKMTDAILGGILNGKI